jgi:hypothetical protein
LQACQHWHGTEGICTISLEYGFGTLRVHQGSFYSSLESINWIVGKANTICDKPTESKASKEESSRKYIE